MKLKLFLLPFSLVGALFVFIYFIQPAWGDYKRIKESLAENKKNLAEIKGHKINLETILTTYKEIDIENKFLLENAIPENLQEETFLKELNSLAFASGVKIIKIDLQKEVEKSNKENLEEKKDVDKYRSELVLAGNYFGLKKILYEIEGMNRFTKIMDYSISKSQQFDNLTLTLNLLLFNKNKVKNQAFSSTDPVFRNLLVDGLDLDTVNEYRNYKEEIVDFNLIEIGEIGKEDLFEDNGEAGEETVAN